MLKIALDRGVLLRDGARLSVVAALTPLPRSPHLPKFALCEVVYEFGHLPIDRSRSDDSSRSPGRFRRCRPETRHIGIASLPIPLHS